MKTKTKNILAPDWAKKYVGQKFNITKATTNKWTNGLSWRKTPKVLWAKQLPEISDKPSDCPYKWLRYVLLLISPKQTISEIKTEVYNVSVMGEADLMTTELLPDDEVLADKEMKKVVK